eukprot:1258509-Heterocapsa_arctica.AAC.1
MQKDASGKYEYPTLVDHSVINSFLKDDHSKLATYRKGLRRALMSSVRLREPGRYSSLPELKASDAQWIVELHKHQEIFPYDYDFPA